MRITAKVDYAIRAAVELASAPDGPTKGSVVASRQQIPPKFLENILAELKHGGIVASQRGADGGYWLARPAQDVTLAQIIRAVEGPLAAVQGVRPDQLEASPLRDVWIAVRANLRAVLEATTVADVAAGKLPRVVTRLVAQSDAWNVH